MRCHMCGNEAVYFQPYSGRHLCGRHLTLDIEARAKRIIRLHRWLRPGDHIAVPLAGDRKSAALLAFLHYLTGRRRDIRLSAILPRERDAVTKRYAAASGVAESLRVPCREIQEPGGGGTAFLPNVTRIAIPVSLDDVAQGVLREFLFGDADRLVHPCRADPVKPRLICPFVTIPDAEIERYWDLTGTKVPLPGAGRAGEVLPKETRDRFGNYCQRHPATQHAIHSLAEELFRGDAAGICCICTGQEVAGDGT